MIKFRCPDCNRLLGAQEKHANTMQKCPNCGTKLKVPCISNEIDICQKAKLAELSDLNNNSIQKEYSDEYQPAISNCESLPFALELNNKQLQAVRATEGYVRVIAGAGSGKTKALATRFAYIVNDLGISASNILCVTFTNKAASEMRNRVRSLIGENADLGYIATYHGFCVRVLREEIIKLQYPKQFIIMDTEDQKTLLRQIYKEFNISSREFSHKKLLKDISLVKGPLYITLLIEPTTLDELYKCMEEFDKSLQSLETFDIMVKDMAAKTVAKCAKRMAIKRGLDLSKLESLNRFIGEVNDDESKRIEIISLYFERQKKNFALDFDDLINFVLYIFHKHSDVLYKWQNRLHYILVDEMQDSSKRQFNLVRMLSDLHKNLFVVGDPDQSIYEWRGATPEILVNFDKSFPDVQTVIMDQNYRSTRNILNIGNAVIANNSLRVEKDLFTLNTEDIDVVHFHGKNESEEAFWVSKEIIRLISEENCKYSDVAILYRSHYVSRSIEQVLMKENIPYSVWGGIRFYERREIKDILSYLGVIVYGDDISFLRIINTPRRGLGRKFLQTLTEIAENSGMSLLEALKSNSNHSVLNRDGVSEFLKILDKFEETYPTFELSSLIQEVLDYSGLNDFYRRDGDEERIDNIKELMNSVILLENEYDEKVELEEYLQDIALYTDRDAEDENQEKVRLMTIHTAKGLEFPHVFLCGFSEGILPNYRSLREGKLEEERRLAYVAITRAEKRLYLTESEGFLMSVQMNKYPSRFLMEVKEGLYVREGTLSKEIIEEAKKAVTNVGHFVVSEAKFQVADLVEHPLWKEGKIVEVDKEKYQYMIEFPIINKVKPISFDFTELRKKDTDICKKEDDFFENIKCKHWQKDGLWYAWLLNYPGNIISADNLDDLKAKIIQFYDELEMEEELSTLIRNTAFSDKLPLDIKL